MSAGVEKIAGQETSQGKPASFCPLFDRVNQILEKEYHLRIRQEFALSVQIGIKRRGIPPEQAAAHIFESYSKNPSLRAYFIAD